MPGLNVSLLTALQGLQAQQGALQATTNNIANANTPGYSRQVPIMVENPPVLNGSLLYGTGVHLQEFKSVRDQVLDLLIAQQTQHQGAADAQTNALQQLQPVFTATGQDIGSQMSAFFTSITKLSTDPSDSALRASFISAGNNLANSFHQTVANVQQIQTGLNQSVVQDVNQINVLTSQISSLNEQLYQLRGTGQDGGALQDQQTELIRQLSELTNISVTSTENGETITTANGVALVVGGQQYPLHTTLDPDGTQHVYAANIDITSQINGGKMGGELTVRDQNIAAIMSNLDTLASEFATAFNAIHRAGYDINGTAGTDFFSVPGTVAGAASHIAVNISDAALVAASSDGSAGSNGNLSALLALQNQALGSGQTPTEAYASMVFQVGLSTANAKADSQGSQLTLQQLTNQRSALSGVSIDEESTNLIRYQQAYAAAARVITTVDQLTNITLNMMSGN